MRFVGPRKKISHTTGGADFCRGGGVLGTRRELCGGGADVGLVLRKKATTTPDKNRRGSCVMKPEGWPRNH